MDTMIKVNLSKLMGENKLTFSSLSKKTGISQGTLSEIYHDKVKMLRFDTIEKLCNYFNIEVGELIENKKAS